VAHNEAPPAVLDIGGDVGALLLHTAPELLGVEIEISPLSGSAMDVFQHEHPHEHGEGAAHVHHHPGRTHVAVLARHLPGGVQHAALYPGLTSGDYQLWNVDGSPADVVHIKGGEITEIDWR
jgi:hypothetical protein